MKSATIEEFFFLAQVNSFGVGGGGGGVYCTWSYINAIQKETMKKLGLKVESHLEPYQFQL